MLTYNDKVCTLKVCSKTCKCTRDKHSTAEMGICKVFQKINMGIDYNLS
ncbi:hypothetical protein JMF89_02685 [Clostridiaceae bacterium UIB06]|uniref:Uncharacterized protein n=1 Tax=Clostridium thailandense TaxID=2794346 RepID=A0A949TPH4_9CLOT|nr:hypothetical protein [Clostridium thailandense]MBV7276594.1 hypothetical protein [Clostridium thailandense]MCH5136117.1 hypothetical protein [Clostridiaceae bacterium UIB06]